MEFEWDEAKRQLVLAKHGLDFLRAGEVLLGRHIVLEGRHVDEIRQIAVGESQGKMIAVVFTRRADRVRLITARRARKDECRTYRAVFG